MTNMFAASEIVEMGIQIENNGRDFYNILADRAQFSKSKEIFKYLAGEEERHIKVFKVMLEGVEQYVPPEAFPGEYFAYMKTLASDYVFTRKGKGEEIAKRIKSDIEAVEMGIGFEKDSILFYEGMKKGVPQHELKIVDDLINQEQRHLRQLMDLRNNL